MRVLFVPASLLICGAIILGMSGCSGLGAPIQDNLSAKKKEDVVMPITLPTKPDVTAPQLAPKIGHLLGKGALALVKTGKQGDTTLEIRDRDFRLVARGEVEQVGWPGQPWSPSGTALAYTKEDTLRIIDFDASQNRLLYSMSAEDRGRRGISTPFLWVGNKMVYHLVGQHYTPPVTVWMIDLQGGQPEEVVPVMADPADGMYLEGGVTAGDVSRDGKTLLISGITRDLEYAAIFLMDVATRVARRVSPRSEDACMAGHFTPDERQIMLNCRQPAEGINPVDVWVVNRDGSDPRRIAKGERVGLFPVGISPDGSQAALHETFIPGLPSQEAIHIVDLRNNERTLLAQAAHGKYVRPVGFDADGKSYLILRQEHRREYQSTIGSLERVDLATGRSEVLAEGVDRAFMADYGR